MSPLPRERAASASANISFAVNVRVALGARSWLCSTANAGAAKAAAARRSKAAGIATRFFDLMLGDESSECLMRQTVGGNFAITRAQDERERPRADCFLGRRAGELSQERVLTTRRGRIECPRIGRTSRGEYRVLEGEGAEWKLLVGIQREGHCPRQRPCREIEAQCD